MLRLTCRGVIDLQDQQAALRYFGNQLRQARNRAGKTQKAAAEATGVQYQTIWSWEAGRNQPSPDHLRTLINFYGIPEEEFNLANALGPKGLADQRARNVIGQKMADLRKDKKMSPALIALLLHEYHGLEVTQSDLFRYENGTAELDSDFLEKYANFFDLTLENLQEGDDLRMVDSPVGIAMKGFVDAGSESSEDEPIGLAASLQGRSLGIFEMQVAGPGLEAEGIKGGDRVFIDPDANLAIGKLFAIKAYDRVTIRKLDIDNDGEVIVASSEAGQIGLKLGDPSIELLGRVVGIFHLL